MNKGKDTNQNVENTIIERREFEDPITGTKYYITAPTADDVRGADWQYSKTYTKSLVEGITTAAEMMDILMRRGVIGPEFEQRQRELTDTIAEKVDALQTTKSLDEKQDLALEVAKLREELFTWNQRLNGPMANTCEQIADDARLEYLTSRMVVNSDGDRIWDDYSDFLTEKNQALAMRARFEVMLYLQGLESDFLENTPEAIAIREIEEEIQARADEVLRDLEETKPKDVDNKTNDSTSSGKAKPVSKKKSRKKKTE